MFWENLGVIVLATAVGHSLMAVCVSMSAGRRLQTGASLCVLGRWGWTLAALCTGAFGAVTYWLCHRGK